jgi:hypothetical protein
MDLERIAYICEQGFLEPSFVMAGHAKVFVDSWEMLSGFIESLRSGRDQPQPREHFERFARECSVYLDQRGERGQ